MKFPKFYKQCDLIELKKTISEDIKNTESLIRKTQDVSTIDTFTSSIKYLEALSNDQIKVKKAIAKNNFLFRINHAIYLNEKYTKKLRLLQDISKGRKDKEFFGLLKKEFTIETVIAKLQTKLQKIKNYQKCINNSFLTKSLLMLETV